MSEEQQCPFCDQGDRIVKENATAKVLLSNPRKVPGHFLVVPKRHIEKPWELNNEEIRDIFDLVFFIEQKIIGKLGDGCDIRQNYRPYVPADGIKSDHVVMHVIPRSNNDYIYSVSEKYEDDLWAALDDKEAEEVAAIIVGK